ncbi:MAG: Secretion system C-terminal sorting domain, partial [Bacteroidota bacterium]
LPQNKVGRLEVFDMTGRMVYFQNLPPWSTLQQIDLGFLESGLYNFVISSDLYRKGQRLAIVR